MRTILVLLTINAYSLFNLSAQNGDIQQLTKQKEILGIQINILKDSIKNIEKHIKFLEANRDIQVGEVLIAEVYTQREANVSDKPSLGGSNIAKISKYKKVKVYDLYDNYWLIKRDSIKGYIHTESIGKTASMNKIEKEYKKMELSKKYDEVIAKNIMNNRVWIGMTRQMARESIGKPDKVNKTSGSYGIHEQWVYKNRYLYFENGKLKSWQN